MYSEKTIIVDVIETGVSEYSLSMKASDLYEAAQAGDVLRRNDVGSVAAPEKKYTVLSGVKLESGTYTFTFANGDAFTASSSDAYPTAASISNDYAAGGGGGGFLLVNATRLEEDSSDGDTRYRLDKTAKQIFDSMMTGTVNMKMDDAGSLTIYYPYGADYGQDYGYEFWMGNYTFTALNDDDYPESPL